MATYTIFGGGPGGLYTAWRLLSGGTLSASDSVEVIEWGNYDYNQDGNGDRNPAGRICSYHYQKDPTQSYIEVGGMRFAQWDPDTKEGHQLVTLTISAIGLEDDVIEFNTTDNPLFYLRGVHFYEDQLGKEFGGKMILAPYNTPGNNAAPASTLIGNISDLITKDNDVSNRVAQCQFYSTGRLSLEFNSFVYNHGDVAQNGGDVVGNLGYWNVFYDQAGNEGFQYAADAGGYSSNVINWNAANAAVYNGEFAPGGAFKTLKTGFSSLFVSLYKKCVELGALNASGKGPKFTLTKNTRLHSIWIKDGQTGYQTASAANPEKADSGEMTTDFAFLAMPPHALELVAGATRYLANAEGVVDFLNTNDVQNYIQSVIVQPSYKVAMFFDTPWWEDTDFVKYPPKLVNKKHKHNVFGPTITDLPLRQVYYFGDNAIDPDNSGKVYGILAAYDDMRFIKFWQEMELPVTARRETPLSLDLQPLHGAGEAPDSMERMLLLQLAKVHWGDPNMAGAIPKPLETTFMDWGFNPFGGGYHAWAAHFDISDVMQRVRTPGRMAGVDDSNIFIVGSAFSNDQAWVEGAFCTAESVLVDYLGLTTIAENTTDYPLICGCTNSCS